MQRLKSRLGIDLDEHDYAVILKNLPVSPDWEGSFYHQLSEYGRWATDEFWILHLALSRSASRLAQIDNVPKKFALEIVTLQSKVDRLLTAHFDPNDVFEIGNLSISELHAFKERFDSVIVAVFSGEVLPESSFDLANPLIASPPLGGQS